MRLAALIAAVLLVPALADEPKPPKGFTALFNGKNLEGWNGRPFTDLSKPSVEGLVRPADDWTALAKKYWKVVSGELMHEGKGPLLTTDQEYGDFELRAELKQLRVGGEGRLYFRGAAMVPLKVPVGDERWHRVRLIQVGERTTLYVNGRMVVDHARQVKGRDRELPLPRMGPIRLGTDGESRWRNLFVREIKSEEANAILRKQSVEGFKDVFNGKDFTGWTGPLDSYEIKDGAIVCKPKKGGNIHTKDEYEDFVARVEYRLPVGGNNGLAIRYPGKGQPSQVAMCEVQILDDEALKYRKLDPRQYNGSVYGMIPAHRGYLRPVGEWNFMEVTVQGHRITVELNGTRIVDGDVSKVTKFKDGTHPGRLLTKGYFGFAGHNDPVAFRLVQIKPLTKTSP